MTYPSYPPTKMALQFTTEDRETPSGKACVCNCCGFGFSIGRPCGIIFCCIPCMC
ncbi:hypothetical protein CC85DRAFT_287708 [Cutaneotrichosporon oleaginosum]|uniref:Uncharacterized protein n=1 Tax=Cutaneotrichosporon oleaginosum TaxID=879819 RepID=A0A0J0XGN6_9TREE|nr:uncharacterized protein CC85DRAFT_287708 [Cutaneotrichosporon oleaginosum]KLT40192.1 hypothetical protein CC85DRAFT_287708 [Cutaneotrichosporon oleaginosum]TXT10517.1 hypothetical protein COLE_04451 [Cutaneotrichosporon oleaginosum]